MSRALATLIATGAMWVGGAVAGAQGGNPQLPEPPTPAAPEAPAQPPDRFPQLDSPVRTGFWARAEVLYAWRVTGQVVDYHGDHQADDFSLTKELGVAQGVVRPYIEAGWNGGVPTMPVSVSASFFEWDVSGDRVQRRGSFYGTTLIPAGEPVESEFVFTRFTFDAGVGIWGYEPDDPWHWRLDIVGGFRVHGAWWQIETVNVGTFNGRAGDPRVFAGVEAHKRLADWLTLHMRGVLGNPSTIVGGYRFGLDANWGALTGQLGFGMGSPTFGEIFFQLNWALSDAVQIGFTWREWFDQLLDGGAFFGQVNEGFIRMNHALVGLSFVARF